MLALQQRLEELGYLTEEYDGHYGAATANCVSNFQVANGLEPTGIADPATQAALFAVGALRGDGTPLPEEAGDDSSSSSEDSSSSQGEGSSDGEGASSQESSQTDASSQDTTGQDSSSQTVDAE